MSPRLYHFRFITVLVASALTEKFMGIQQRSDMRERQREREGDIECECGFSGDQRDETEIQSSQKVHLGTAVCIYVCASILIHPYNHKERQNIT